jgi:hypothetical protein
MRGLFFTINVCGIMPVRGNVFTLPGADCWRTRGPRQSLIPVLPNGDPLELSDQPDKRDKEVPDEPGRTLPSYPTDVPAPEPHDPPAWQPIDDPPPDTGEPSPKPRSIP